MLQWLTTARAVPCHAHLLGKSIKDLVPFLGRLRTALHRIDGSGSGSKVTRIVILFDVVLEKPVG